MSDLISRSELVKLLEDRKREHYENYESFINYMCNRKLKHETEYEECKRILTIVTNQPSVEAVPVVHGEWLDTQPDYNNGFRRNARVCSNCHDYYTKEYDDLYFCPRCGADMRKKV